MEICEERELLKPKEGMRRFVWFWFVLWCVLALGIWLQAKQTIQTISTVNELGSKVEEVRHFFNFDLPYRVKHVDQVSLKLQLAYAVRLQLESEFSEGKITPDITQLLYATDRFLESARAFVGSDSELVSLAEQLRRSRSRDENSEQIQSMYYRLGALVLESIFSDSATNSDTYRDLDRLFIESDTLSPQERSAFQRQLAQTSSALSAKAQGSYLVNQLLNPDFPNQLTSINDQLEQKLMTFVTWLSVISGLFLSLISWGLFSQRTVQPLTPSRAEDKESEQAGGSYVVFSAQSESAQNGQVNEQSHNEPNTSQVAVVEREPYIDINKMLDSLSGDESAVRMLLEVFIQDHSGDGSKMHRLLEEDKEQAQRAAHSLKGVSGSLGAMPLHCISGDIELLIKQGQKVPEEKLTRLDDVLKQTILFANHVLNSEKIQEALTD
ncbi:MULTISPECIES: Hpt domain-containing protein [Vibrio diabolicus subgroup]|uniref:Hpt domain-containing protein n=1 Tax=Vibrio diabolicus subgroup TaxID=2315253 RepID=UPI00211B1E57|nr:MULTISPECIES: Hpt domain-containing protein [Vibrio diabolicus subgroup]MCG9231240.1 Hpt domain-containing protein [Vibrio diabolicus]MCG9570919.1 Hpt domain-containing protein [Vibrio diabolicus]MCG9593585.1 Hpt domain-containing protein [Vibrio diabolicus]MCR9966082.1 Hpt domain-containing protein [Vibrio antiquarius]MCS0335744.1 Hpt domain-containing protein [Vibrio diabolicus]